MIEVFRDRFVPAPPDRVWPLVEDPDRLSRWFAFAQRVEVLEGRGLGRRQRLHGRWGTKRAEVDQVVIEYEPGRALGWRHEAERLDGKPAPLFASETTFRISLEPEEGGTRVWLHSAQRPAGRLKGMAMKLFGSKEVARNMERSLETLSALVSRAA